jgi:cell division protein FtsI (penicillin-binding protein 3)
MDTATIRYLGRQRFVLAVLFMALALLAARATNLQLEDKDYLQAQGAARYQRTQETASHRGMIMDRHGTPLAVSTPVDSVWAHPPTLWAEGHSWGRLAKLLGTTTAKLKKQVRSSLQRKFVYLKRHIPPARARQLMALAIPGVDIRREYRRYYPSGPVFGQVIGFTDIDDRGQEGLELAYDDQLAGAPGKALVLRDRVGHVVEHTALIQPVRDGSDLRITLDARLQYLAYRHLKSAVRKHRARGASLVMLDARNGEVLAMVNEPSFNPNNRADRQGNRFRNRAATDVFEPGSTMKPFTVAAALQHETCVPDTRIDTSPGVLKIGGHRIRDTRDYGLLTVSKVVMKSSNIGAAKIAMRFSPNALVETFSRLGFGASTNFGFPGEVAGNLPVRRKWRPVEHATLSYGYGLSTTALQLARAYTALATDGELLPASLLPRVGPVERVRVFEPRVVAQVRHMLELAVSDQGTGSSARIDRYRVAGKTGTVHKIVNGRYADDRYLSVFAGFAPVRQPRLVMVVVVDDPRGADYFGGKVAAPVFSQVMTGALRLLNVAPELDPPALQQVRAARRDA